MSQEFFSGCSAVLHFLGNHLFAINIILAIVIVFFERRDPRSLWAWLLLLWFMPGLGFFLYLIIGQDMRKSKMFKNKELDDAICSAVYKQEKRVKSRDIFPDENERMSRYRDLVMYNLEAAKSVYTDNNEVEIFTDGRKYFADLYEEMEKAKKFIHIQSYIIKNDELWQELEKLLERKVREGVEVRILYDSMGQPDNEKK